MNANVYDWECKVIRTIELPEHFQEEVRVDIIRKVTYSYWSNRRQPYGSYKFAGMEASAWTSKRRRTYRTSYGFGISRVPRSIFSGHWGYYFLWYARIVPNAVKGRRAHPPKPEKIWRVKVNKKEKKKAIRSAIAASIKEEMIKNRYPKLFKYIKPVIDKYKLPLIISDLEKVKKTRELKDILYSFGLKETLEYIKEFRRNRAGSGKRRGRRLERHRGILVVVSSDFNNYKLKLEGVEVEKVDRLDIDKLAPGGEPGRFIIWSDKAIEELNNLYI
ncbi:MAG: 50S ribosomal protein L4 [Candidatus Nanoclepta minutus]|uniref:50S ribosomal protein L4 n=1 Tax=Candidatus Nanoclepta minutus TaxID=1940235 RepID=A0A397WMR7_9ARCH|nr:MAG: 50S ribosomal protein L4 [Candidatus Nanoclepta minutus]